MATVVDHLLAYSCSHPLTSSTLHLLTYSPTHLLTLLTYSPYSPPHLLSSSPAQFVRGQRVLELGSGIGISGLSAALAGAAHVTLTDVAEDERWPGLVQP